MNKLRLNIVKVHLHILQWTTPKLRALQEFHVQCSSLTPAGAVWTSLRRTAVGEGARSAVRRRGDVFLGVCRRRRRRGGVQLYQLRAAWGATGQLSGIWLGLWVSASGGAAQSASMFIGARPFKAELYLICLNNECFDFQPVLHILILVILN